MADAITIPSSTESKPEHIDSYEQFRLRRARYEMRCAESAAGGEEFTDDEGEELYESYDEMLNKFMLGRTPNWAT